MHALRIIKSRKAPKCDVHYFYYLVVYVHLLKVRAVWFICFDY